MDPRLLDYKRKCTYYFVEDGKIKLMDKNCTPKQFAIKVYTKILNKRQFVNNKLNFDIETKNKKYYLRMNRTKLDPPITIGDTLYIYNQQIELLNITSIGDDDE